MTVEDWGSRCIVLAPRGRGRKPGIGRREGEVEVSRRDLRPEKETYFYVGTVLKWPMPRTLVKTVTVPRFTIRTEGGSTTVSDTGTDEREARRPSRRSTISSEEFFEAMKQRSATIPDKLKQFLDEVAAIDVRAEYLASLNLKWDQPEGKTGESWLHQAKRRGRDSRELLAS